MSEKARYVSKGYKNLKLLMSPTMETLVTDSRTGKQTKHVEPAKYISFNGYEYITQDSDEIAFLRSHPAMLGQKNGKPSRIMFEETEVIDIQKEIEYVELVEEFGKDRVLSMLKRQKEKAQQKAVEARQAVRDSAETSKKKRKKAQ